MTPRLPSLPKEFDAAQACAYSGASMRQVRYWDKIGLVRPSVQSTDGRMGRRRVYSRSDVLKLKAVAELRAVFTLQRLMTKKPLSRREVLNLRRTSKFRRAIPLRGDVQVNASELVGLVAERLGTEEDWRRPWQEVRKLYVKANGLRKKGSRTL